ncbi:unnamed protein product [Tilletia controversa]|uniref:Uncharacterized protein n=2 Tax=Tilletia TaxID=13289 RepID=A0A8X7MK17_9BASI|nr:hypothetical protein CF335_g6787 [Tilletia laevis]KAE8238307.1 hypothetical protein A4X06_0g8879 [Tilletia controversa]KAE8248540.1 hypothetical protein A4X03_0g6755 [Tilletia caries]CAD6888728.1 unnamed protein product [Tilletia caries]CAD6903728.1 unnamed protein product [Tilletia controversa]
MARLAFAALAALAFAAITNASPLIASRQNRNPTCGTAGDATLSDCQALVDNWPNFGNYERTCTFSVSQTAYNPACFGNCCVYVTTNQARWDDPDAEIGDIRKAAQAILGCGSAEKNSVNGVIDVEQDGVQGRVCLSDGAGCGDCFSD